MAYNGTAGLVSGYQLINTGSTFPVDNNTGYKLLSNDYLFSDLALNEENKFLAEASFEIARETWPDWED